MPRPRKPNPALASVATIAGLLHDFDYKIDREDLVLYDVAELVNEDRASFDDEVFRRVIDEGIRVHIEENPLIRARLSGVLRTALQNGLNVETEAVLRRTIRAVEDVGSGLCHISAIVRSYTLYVFERLGTTPESADDAEVAGNLIDRWHQGEILREQLVAKLKALSHSAVAPAADLLLESPGDRMAAEAAIAILSAIPSAASARVLAHAIAEPLLEEDLEAAAYSTLKALWPLSREYMLRSLRQHAHEDIPFRWFQLFVEVDELSTVELVLEEVRAHGGSADYREDLASLLDALQKSGDPDVEEKVLATLNAVEAADAVRPMLDAFLREFRRTVPDAENPWVWQAKQRALNRDYLAAAKMLDEGKRSEALAAVERILEADPQYPFAVMLKGFMPIPS